MDDVIGNAALIVWPISRFGCLDSPDIQQVEAGADGWDVVAPGLLAGSGMVLRSRRPS